VPGAWVFVAEHVPQRHVGFACGTLTAGLTGGILLGSLVATAVNRSYDPVALLEEGWRLPFILGGVFGLVSVWLRQYLHETPVFREMQARQQLAAELPLKTVVREHRPAIVLTMLLTWLLSAAIVVMILMTPTLVQKLFAIPAATALQANSIATLFLSVGCIASGALADRFGAGRVLAIGCMGLGATSWLFYRQMGVAPEHIYSMYALCGFFVGVIGVVPSVAVQSFPPVVRFSGLSFSYNVAYAIFGGLTPVLVSRLLPLDALAPVHYMLALCVVGVGLGVYLRRHEQRAGIPRSGDVSVRESQDTESEQPSNTEADGSAPDQPSNGGSTQSGLPWGFVALAAAGTFLFMKNEMLGTQGGFIYIIGAIIVGILSANMLTRR
jgi:MFS family permease